MSPPDGRQPTAGALLHVLVASGVVTLADVVSRGVELEERSMSHVTYRVSVGGEPWVFVKHVDSARSGGRNLRAEAAVYRLAQADPRLTAVTPPCRLVSDDDTLIVLDVVPENRGRVVGGFGHSDATVMAEYGRAVAQVHSIVTDAFGEAPALLMALESGWDTAEGLPIPVQRLFATIAGLPEFRDGFMAAQQAWQPERLVHGDLRWSNVLVDGAGNSPRVVLVDWELACLGDRAWDIGSVIADVLLAACLTTRRVCGMPELVAFMTPFLSAYVEQPDNRADWILLMERSSRLAGVRIVQTISEYGHTSPEEMEAVEGMLLPWSADLLRDPTRLAGALADTVGS